MYNLEKHLSAFNLFIVVVYVTKSTFSLTIVNNGSGNILLVHPGNV